MTIRFWGVRGSIPVSARHTLQYGGNTSCLSVEVDDKVLILDAGTGIRPLGAWLVGDGRDIYILLSHLHWDHITGFPFFDPLYEKGRVIHLLDYQADGQAWSLLSLLDGIHFPIRPRDLPSTIRRVEGDVLAFLEEEGIAVRCLPLNHPGGALGYRVAHRGRALVYMPDNELQPPVPTTTFDAFVDFCRGADVLCHDAQYLLQDMPVKLGWGHSLVDQACRLAVEAGVGHLVLLHHDPNRSDEELDALQAYARGVLSASGISCTAAYEGLALELG
jgi:phosphoribosyl 1,2-cyclic phosphodiesterase